MLPFLPGRACALAALGVLPLLGAAETPKTYTLFMGVDFSVPQDKEFYRIRDVNGGSFVIQVRDEEVLVPMRHGSGSLKVDTALKMTPLCARIDHLKTDRAYSAARDPFAKFNGRSGAALGADAAQQRDGILTRDARDNATNLRQNLADANQGKTPAQKAENLAEVETAEGRANLGEQNLESSAHQLVKSDYNNTGLAALELQSDLAEENFDALRYSFALSSDEPLNRPYLVFVVRYHEKDARPGTHEGTSIYAKAIEPVGPRPAKINILQTGLPVGFVMEECQVRLYNGGQEIATTVAPRRVALSPDDAFAYLKADRIGRARGATLPAAPALGRPDEETRSQLSPEQQKRTYYVKVTRDGRAERVFLDASLTMPADDTVARVVGNIRFYPALEKSEEKEGVAKLQFSQIPI